MTRAIRRREACEPSADDVACSTPFARGKELACR